MTINDRRDGLRDKGVRYVRADSTVAMRVEIAPTFHDDVVAAVVALAQILSKKGDRVQRLMHITHEMNEPGDQEDLRLKSQASEGPEVSSRC